MEVIKIIFLVLLLSAATVIAQDDNNEEDLDCDDLDIDTDLDSPINGNDLTFCRTSEEQCCDNTYFMERAVDLRTDILSGLREELNDHEDILEYIIDNLYDYLENRYVIYFLRMLPTRLSQPMEDEFLRPFADTLKSHLVINDDEEQQTGFTVAGYIQSLLDAAVELTIDTIVIPRVINFNNEQRNCVTQQLNALINVTQRDLIVFNLTEIRKSLTSIVRIKGWFNNTFRSGLANFEPLSTCVNEFITLRCESCRRKIPDICRDVCNAVIYGCFAPFQIGLEEQFNILWNVTNQIVDNAGVLTRNSGPQLNNIYLANVTDDAELMTLAVGIILNCGLQVNSSALVRKRRDDDVDSNDSDDFDIPRNVSRNAIRLKNAGIFRYGNKGPDFCLDLDNEECWNGREVTSSRLNFANTTIEGQRGNPVVNYNITELKIQARELDSTAPVSNYLRSENFQNVAPEGLIIPNATTSEVEPNAAGNSVAYFTLVLILTIFVLVLI